MSPLYLHSCAYVSEGMSRLRPSEIRYVQDSINSVFDQRSNHWNQMIGETLDKLCEGEITVDSIPKIEVYRRDGLYWSADNRRLWVFRQYERLGGCRDIPVILRPYFNIPINKLTTNNDGKSIRVRRNYPGGSWYRKPDNALAASNNNTLYQRDSSLGRRYETPNLNSGRNLSPRRQTTASVTPDVFGGREVGLNNNINANLVYGQLAQPNRHEQLDGIGAGVRGLHNILYHRDSSLGRRYETPSLNSGKNVPPRRQTAASVTPDVFGGREVGLNNNINANLVYGQITQPNRHEQLDDVGAGVRRLQIPRTASHTYLDPDNVKYTKKSIPSKFSGRYSGVPLRSVAQALLTSRTGDQTNIPPIIVYRVFEEDRVVDGNRRVWAYRLARRNRPSIRIPAVIKTDVEEYKTKIRENNSQITLTLRDILLFDGEDIEVLGE